MKIPTTIIAGDNLSWTDSVPLYPASQGYTLHYALLKSGTRIVIDSTASNDDHAVAVLPATTAAYATGAYEWTAYVTKGSGGSAERYTVGSGRTTILPDLSAQSGGYDNRTQSRKILEDLKTAYQTYITNGSGHVGEYEIAGRRMKYRSAAEILQQINYWEAKCAAEDRQAAIANGQAPANRLLVRF